MMVAIDRVTRAYTQCRDFILGPEPHLWWSFLWGLVLTVVLWVLIWLALNSWVDRILENVPDTALSCQPEQQEGFGCALKEALPKGRNLPKPDALRHALASMQSPTNAELIAAVLRLPGQEGSGDAGLGLQDLCRRSNNNSIDEDCQTRVSDALDDIMQPVKGTFAYASRRVILGHIQFVTLLLFMWGGVFAWSVWHYEKGLRIKFFGQQGSESAPEDRGLFEDIREKLSRPEESREPEGPPTSVTLGRLNENAEQSGVSNTRPWKIFRTFAQSFAARRSTTEATNVLKGEVDQWREELSSSGAFLNFCIFAIPSVGFIGTVLGISNALGGADAVVSEETEALQVSAIQEMTSRLALAFDTTLVALVLVVLLTAIWTTAQRWREKFVTDYYDHMVREMLPALDGRVGVRSEGEQAEKLSRVEEHIDAAQRNVDAARRYFDEVRAGTGNARADDA